MRKSAYERLGIPGPKIEPPETSEPKPEPPMPKRVQEEPVVRKPRRAKGELERQVRKVSQDLLNRSRYATPSIVAKQVEVEFMMPTSKGAVWDVFQKWEKEGSAQVVMDPYRLVEFTPVTALLHNNWWKNSSPPPIVFEEVMAWIDNEPITQYKIYTTKKRVIEP